MKVEEVIPMSKFEKHIHKYVNSNLDIIVSNKDTDVKYCGQLVKASSDAIYLIDEAQLGSGKEFDECVQRFSFDTLKKSCNIECCFSNLTRLKTATTEYSERMEGKFLGEDVWAPIETMAKNYFEDERAFVHTVYNDEDVFSGEVVQYHLTDSILTLVMAQENDGSIRLFPLGNHGNLTKNFISLIDMLCLFKINIYGI